MYEKKDAVALCRHMIVKGNKPDLPCVCAQCSRKFYIRQVFSEQISTNESVEIEDFLEIRVGNGCKGVLGWTWTKMHSPFSLSWPAKSDSDGRRPALAAARILSDLPVLPTQLHCCELFANLFAN
jgi:hypothetical protein